MHASHPKSILGLGSTDEGSCSVNDTADAFTVHGQLLVWQSHRGLKGKLTFEDIGEVAEGQIVSTDNFYIGAVDGVVLLDRSNLGGANSPVSVLVST